jgi:hypothetical protein
MSGNIILAGRLITRMTAIGAVGGPLADPADDREEHPQKLVLPGGRRDHDRGAAGEGDGEQQLAVVRVAHRAAHAEGGDGGAEGEEERDLQGAGEAEAEQGAVQGLVGEVVRASAEADAGHVVHPVGVRVVRQRRPGQCRTAGEGRAEGGGGGAAAGEPQERGEEQQGRLEGGGEADEGAARALPADDEAADQDEQDREDAGLAEPEGVADRQGQHEQADRGGRGEQRGAAADRLGQGAGGDQAEGDDQEQGAQGPAPAEGLFGRTGEGFEDEAAERGAGEARRVVERALDVQHAVRPDPGLEVGQPLASRGAEDHGELADGEDRRHQPQGHPSHAQPRSRLADRRRSDGSRRSSGVLRIRHASSASRPVRHPVGGSRRPRRKTQATPASPDVRSPFVRKTI